MKFAEKPTRMQSGKLTVNKLRGARVGIFGWVWRSTRLLGAFVSATHILANQYNALDFLC